MSLLEDVFLEDEAGEAEELERVIEGDEFDERPAPQSGEDSNDNSEKEDEAEEDKRRVDPSKAQTKRVSKNPRVILNPARLTGPRGIQVIPDHFKDFKFKGKGHEKEDLDLVLKKLEHWAYRLYPKFQFEDCLKKIETLGKKRPVMVHLHKIRSDQYISDEVVVQRDSSDEAEPAEEDEFDKLLQQQIELARATPASSKKGFPTPRVDTPSFSMPKATSSPSISDEQKERMIRNRRLAEERRLARLRNAEHNISVINEVPIEVEDNQNKFNVEHNENIVNDVPIVVENHQNGFNVNHSKNHTVNDEPIDVENQIHSRKKYNRSNTIDSSDNDCDELVVNEAITVDVHDTRPDIDVNKDQLNRPVDRKRNRSKIDSSDEEIVKIDDENHVTEVNGPIKKHNLIIDSDDAVSNNIEDRPDIVNDKSQSDLVTDIEENAEVSKNATDNQVTQNETDKEVTNEIPNEFELNTDEELSSESINRENDLVSADHSETNEGVSSKANTDSKKCAENYITTEELKSLNSAEIEMLPSNNKENIDDNNVDLELMDVDFNEDF
ncbi:putative leucine-rich repeat-containing protein DDB_G0290503 [Plodia interpunctella]|uniref:putative leucine-rich repeat-containing protein DDB_G0290503 n=1 Tax=Plodia interpunctella TaxID=58824 RepID=UPI0023678F1F|nr:putative leucine-rich repeat-containing protein DDB_G0290503 [Plodia interpunctella]